MAKEGNDRIQAIPRIDLTSTKGLKSIVRQKPEEHWKKSPPSEKCSG